MVVYSINSRCSFEQTTTFLQQVKRIKSEQDYTPIVLLGNKSDLENDREVSTQEAREFAKQHQIEFFETSAKTRSNIEESFFCLIRLISQFRHNEKIFFTGNGVERFFKLNTIDLSNYEIPVFNKNLKNIWLIIFRFLFSSKNRLESKNFRLQSKLVCKHWYHLIQQHFETKNYQQQIMIDKSRCSVIISTNPFPSFFNSLKKYVFLINFCDYLSDQSTEKQIHLISNLANSKNNKKLVSIVFFNLKLFKSAFDNQNKDKKISSKKIVSKILKDFSKYQVIDVEDLSNKNITSIFKKLEPKKHKLILEKLKLF